MGVNYTQNCILGFVIKAEDLLVELSPEISEEQPRYDTRTGKVSHYENVVMKQAETVYRFENLEDDWMPELVESISNKYPHLYCGYNTNDPEYDTPYIYIGYQLGESNDNGNNELLDGEISLEELEVMKNNIIKQFPEFQDEIKIHFFWWAG